MLCNKHWPVRGRDLASCALQDSSMRQRDYLADFGLNPALAHAHIEIRQLLQQASNNSCCFQWHIVVLFEHKSTEPD